MKEIQSSIDNWNGKDIWQSCNEFIREGVLYKVSNSGKTIGHLSNRIYPTERRAFLFDGLLVLCKPCNKRIVPGRGDNSQLEWRYKERFFIRNIEIIDRDERYVRSNFSNLFSNLGVHNSSNITSTNACNSVSNTNDSQSSNNIDQSMSSLSLTVNSSSNLAANDNTIHAFEVTQTYQNQSIVLVAKTAEEKDSWIAQLILLNMRSMLERTLDAKLSDEAKKYPLLLPHPSVYRFAIEDMDSNIILEEVKANVPLIKGATLLKLVERLTYHKYGDPTLVRVFLTTYRSFCTPCEFLKLLIERFEIPEPDFRSCMQALHYTNDELASPTSMAPPTPESILDQAIIEGISDTSTSNIVGPTSPTSPTLSINTLPTSPNDLNIFFDEQDEQHQHDYREVLKRFRKEYAQPVQFRVLNVLRHWIDKHYYDFEQDNQLLDILNEFLDEKLAKSKVAKWCHHIRSVIDRSQKLQKSNDHCDNCSVFNVSMIEHPLVQSEEFDLLTYSPGAFADHLTLFEFELYRAVKPYELIGRGDQSLVWTKKNKHITSPNLLKMMRHYSVMVYYFEKSIVEAENFEERCAIVTRIVEILIRLIEYNNFNGAFEIVGALESASVHRLEHTKAYIERNSKLKKAWEETKELISDHWKKYKEKLFSINPPCVPFLGNFLTDIVHLEEGNPQYILPSNSENFSLHESTNSSIILDDSVSSKLINFQKKRRVAESIFTIFQQYQNVPYQNLRAFNPNIWNFLEKLDLQTVFPDMEEKDIGDYLYNKSVEIEPRNSKQPTKFVRY
ncbi:son of sevenless 2-like protein [Sarcoptes scabiei]|uniref:Son of sevenless 2-like protein n=1 Tax=Sarcoptes scabiei TaxID=52283 RepID=A0A131ZVG7_SARSC|nr:son of sevenless 2-like protein [Sarcoptes scabiei]